MSYIKLRLEKLAEDAGCSVEEYLHRLEEDRQRRLDWEEEEYWRQVEKEGGRDVLSQR